MTKLTTLAIVCALLTIAWAIPYPRSTDGKWGAHGSVMAVLFMFVALFAVALSP